MRRRILTIQSVVNEQIEKFQTDLINKYTDNIHINSDIYDQIINKNYQIIELCLNKLDKFLSEWNGVNLNHTKKKLSTFRQYFIISRSWYTYTLFFVFFCDIHNNEHAKIIINRFDQRKKEILATDLWINVLDIIISVFCVFYSLNVFYSEIFLINKIK